MERELHYTIYQRNNEEIIIKDPQGFLLKYEILYIIPFSSERKSMGIIVKNMESSVITFFLKGADSVISEKVNKQEKIWINEEIL